MLLSCEDEVIRASLIVNRETDKHGVYFVQQQCCAVQSLFVGQKFCIGKSNERALNCSSLFQIATAVSLLQRWLKKG